MRVIGSESNQLGIMLLEQARMKAAEMELDLVEVAPNATPPVCKIMDYGKYLYQEQKREHQAHKHAHASEMKEVKLKTRIGKHDLEIKVGHAKEFLGMGHRVKFTMVFKGREITHLEIGEQILKEVVVLLADTGKVERPPYREGRAMGLIIAPKNSVSDKPKSHSGGEKPKQAEKPKAPAPIPAPAEKPKEAAAKT